MGNDHFVATIFSNDLTAFVEAFNLFVHPSNGLNLAFLIDRTGDREGLINGYL